MKKLMMIVMLGVFLTGCNEPTLDASSKEAGTKSAIKVRASLSEGDKLLFDKSLELVAWQGIDGEALLASVMASAMNGTSDLLIGITQSKIMDNLHGKTGQEVIEMGKPLIKKAEQAKVKREQAEAKARTKELNADKLRHEENIKGRRQTKTKEISRLENKKAEWLKSSKKIKNLEVISSRLYKKQHSLSMGAKYDQMAREEGMATYDTAIDITIKNNTKYALKSVYFDGVYATPNRSIHWHKSPVNASISGGVEQGETFKGTLTYDRWSSWGKVSPIKGAVLTLTPTRLFGADGKEIFSTVVFSKDDEKRLLKLKQESN